MRSSFAFVVHDLTPNRRASALGDVPGATATVRTAPLVLATAASSATTPASPRASSSESTVTVTSARAVVGRGLRYSHFFYTAWFKHAYPSCLVGLEHRLCIAQHPDQALLLRRPERAVHWYALRRVPGLHLHRRLRCGPQLRSRPDLHPHFLPLSNEVECFDQKLLISILELG